MGLNRDYLGMGVLGQVEEVEAAEREDAVETSHKVLRGVMEGDGG